MKCLDCKHRSFFPNEICPHCYHFSKYDPKPKTNADRIRAMSDEELAKTLPWVIQDEICKPICDDDNWEPESCQKCLLDWLRREANP